MKKNRNVKKRSVIMAFAFVLTNLNAAEQRSTQSEAFSLLHQGSSVDFVSSDVRLTIDDVFDRLTQGMNATEILFVRRSLQGIHPDRYADFINIVERFTSGMDVEDKVHVIIGAGNVAPNRYKDFMNVVHQLSQEMTGFYKALVINGTGYVDPDLYEVFINVVHQLSHDMNNEDKARIINAMGCIGADRYTDAFIMTVNQLSQGMNGIDKAGIIGMVGKIHFMHYPFLQNFIRLNPTYFEYVPIHKLQKKITSNMNQLSLQVVLQLFHRAYYHQAPTSTPQALAFEIHKFSRQKVVGETDEKKPFSDAVLAHVQRSIKGSVFAYHIVLDLLRAELTKLKNDPLTSQRIYDEVFNWVIESNDAPKDKDTMALIVTYLEQKDDTHQKLSTWLYTFMEESQKAYKGQNGKSCTQGVKERVITSLRSAVLQGDAVLENLFNQAESSLMIATKSKKLGDCAFLTRRLQEKGVTSSTPQGDAKIKFSEFLHDYFQSDSAKDVIKETLNAFEDSQPNSGDGLWSKVKAEWLNLQQGGVQPACAQ